MLVPAIIIWSCVTLTGVQLLAARHLGMLAIGLEPFMGMKTGLVHLGTQRAREDVSLLDLLIHVSDLVDDSQFKTN